MVDRQQTVGHGINVRLCVLCVSGVKLVVSRLIFLQMETDGLNRNNTYGAFLFTPRLQPGDARGSPITGLKPRCE